MPLAQVQVTRKMNDSLLVIDDEGYIVELNPAARILFCDQAPDLVGVRFSAVFAAWPALVEVAAGREAKLEEIRLESGYLSGYYLVMIEPLTGFGAGASARRLFCGISANKKRCNCRIWNSRKRCPS